MRTIGISPKVYLPAAAQFLAGILLILTGLDTEGQTAILTGLGTLGIGYTAKPGTVR